MTRLPRALMIPAAVAASSMTVGCNTTHKDTSQVRDLHMVNTDTHEEFVIGKSADNNLTLFKCAGAVSKGSGGKVLSSADCNIALPSAKSVSIDVFQKRLVGLVGYQQIDAVRQANIDQMNAIAAIIIQCRINAQTNSTDPKACDAQGLPEYQELAAKIKSEVNSADADAKRKATVDRIMAAVNQPGVGADQVVSTDDVYRLAANAFFASDAIVGKLEIDTAPDLARSPFWTSTFTLPQARLTFTNVLTIDNFSGSLAACAGLNTPEQVGWRMPTAAEFIQVVKNGKAPPSDFYTFDEFDPQKLMWVVGPNGESLTDSFRLQSETGKPSGPDFQNLVFCVRSYTGILETTPPAVPN